MKVFRLLNPEWWIQRLQYLSYWTLAAVGIVLMCSGLVLAAYVERKEVATAMVFATTLIGAVALSLALPKVLAQIIDEERARQKLTEEKLKAESDARVSKERLLEAQQEVARLERMQLCLTAIKPVAERFLLTVEMTIKDFLDKKVGPTDEPKPPKLGPIPMGKPRQPFYTGAIEIPVKAHLGVDLQQVRIKEDPAGRLIIGGLTMTTSAETVCAARFPLAEVRTRFYANDEVVEIQINPSDKRLMAERDKHEHQLRERIRAGQEFTIFEKPLLQSARDAIKALLMPMGREIVFVEVPPCDAKPLMNFLADEQQLLANQYDLVPSLMWFPIGSAYFSDSILLWVPYHRSFVHEFLQRCSRVFCQALSLDMPIRGAIAFGQAVLDSQTRTFLGNPLVEAARLEASLDWIGVALGASVKCLQFPTDTILHFTPPMKEGGTEIFSDLVLDWPRFWRSTRSDFADDYLRGLCSPNHKPNVQKRYDNAIGFVFHSRKNEDWALKLTPAAPAS